MSGSLRALLAGSIDYAGLFPPAKLTLEDALYSYVRYRREAEGWLLGRFLCPAARLSELAEFAELLDKNQPFRVAAVAAAVETGGAFVCGLFREEAFIWRFRDKHGARATVDAFEARLPIIVSLPQEVVKPGMEELVTPRAVARNLLEALHLILGSSASVPVAPFLEVDFKHENWRALVGAVIAEITRYPAQPAGFKLRCGGTEPAAIPTPEQVAFTLVACRDAGLPLKFTAGLHQPIRRLDAKLQAPVHGFLNVFVAGALAHARKLSEQQLRPILEDQDASHFVFGDAELRWLEYSATTAEIESARAKVLSFGSCSFNEPREGLHSLGLF